MSSAPSPTAAVGDEVVHPTLGRRRLVAVDERSPDLKGQRVCIEVFHADHVWGGWAWLPDTPSDLSLRRA